MVRIYKIVENIRHTYVHVRNDKMFVMYTMYIYSGKMVFSGENIRAR